MNTETNKVKNITSVTKTYLLPNLIELLDSHPKFQVFYSEESLCNTSQMSLSASEIGYIESSAKKNIKQLKNLYSFYVVSGLIKYILKPSQNCPLNFNDYNSQLEYKREALLGCILDYVYETKIHSEKQNGSVFNRNHELFFGWRYLDTIDVSKDVSQDKLNKQRSFDAYNWLKEKNIVDHDYFPVKSVVKND